MHRRLFVGVMTLALLVSGLALSVQAQDLIEDPILEEPFAVEWKIAGVIGEDGVVEIREFEAETAGPVAIREQDVEAYWDGAKVIVKVASILELPPDMQLDAVQAGIREITGTNAQIREFCTGVENAEPTGTPLKAEVAGSVNPNAVDQGLFSVVIELSGAVMPMF